MFATDVAMPITELAQACEARGFASLYLPEHTHIPTSRSTPAPTGDAALPEEYRRTLDPFVALSTAAAVTEKLRIGTGICLVVEHDPIVLAKQVASLDHESGGRFIFGIGAGWNEEEMRNHGTDPARRFGVLRERVEAMKAIWSQEEASYHGDHVSFDGVWSWPKPAQSPHPPILLGGHGRGVLERVARYADEWFPNRIGSDDKVIARIEELGRPCTLALAPTEPELIERYAAAGVHRCVYWVPPGLREDLERRLDRLAGQVLTG